MIQHQEFLKSIYYNHYVILLCSSILSLAIIFLTFSPPALMHSAFGPHLLELRARFVPPAMAATESILLHQSDDCKSLLCFSIIAYIMHDNAYPKKWRGKAPTSPCEPRRIFNVSMEGYGLRSLDLKMHSTRIRFGS